MQKTCCLVTRLATGALLLCTAFIAGCERKEEVLDVETPDGQIEVERSKDTGEFEIEVDR